MRPLSVDFYEVFKNVVGSNDETVVADVISLASECLSGLNDSLSKG